MLAINLTDKSYQDIIPAPAGTLIKVNFNTGKVEPGAPERRTTSLYKSDGKPKATAAEPIRRKEDIAAMQAYYKKRNLRDYTLFTVGILFGLRASDILALRLHHVLNADGTFKPHCDLIEKKTRKFNNPVITPEIAQILANYINTLKEPSLDDPLFQSRERNADGSPRTITIRQLENILKRGAKACGIRAHISTHSLRKTFAYHMIKSNPNNDEVKFALQTMLNHNDFKTTLTYCGLTQDAVDNYRAALQEGIL